MGPIWWQPTFSLAFFSFLLLEFQIKSHMFTVSMSMFVISCAFANVFVMLCAPSEFKVQDVYYICAEYQSVFVLFSC
jgi:hypothetical protein